MVDFNKLINDAIDYKLRNYQRIDHILTKEELAEAIAELLADRLADKATRDYYNYTGEDNEW